MIGAWRAPFAARSFFVGLLGVSLALAVLTDNAAHNGHWTLDPLGVALVVFTASTCAWAVRVRRGWGVALVAAVGVLGVFAGHWERRLPEHLAEMVHPPVHATPGATRARPVAERPHERYGGSSSRAVSPRSAQVEGSAERRVYDGFAFHLTLTMPETDLRARERANAEMLADPRSPRFAREPIACVVHAAPEESERMLARVEGSGGDAGVRERGVRRVRSRSAKRLSGSVGNGSGRAHALAVSLSR